jgi:hypothetical protein
MKFGMEIMDHGVINGLQKSGNSVIIGLLLLNYKKPWPKVELKWVITVFLEE